MPRTRYTKPPISSKRTVMISIIIQNAYITVHISSSLHCSCYKGLRCRQRCYFTPIKMINSAMVYLRKKIFWCVFPLFHQCWGNLPLAFWISKVVLNGFKYFVWFTFQRPPSSFWVIIPTWCMALLFSCHISRLCSLYPSHSPRIEPLGLWALKPLHC